MTEAEVDDLAVLRSYPRTPLAQLGVSTPLA